MTPPRSVAAWCAAACVFVTGCECAGPPLCPGGSWVETAAGPVCVITARDAGADPADDPACDLRGLAPRASRFDGLGMSRGPRTTLGESFYSSGGGDLVAHDGAMWWVEANDRCGSAGREIWWGLQAFRFHGDAEGHADVLSGCEPETYTAAAPRLFATRRAVVTCYQGHHPYLHVTCGRLGPEPGDFEWTDEHERPRSFIAGDRADGVVLGWRHMDTGEQGVRYYDGESRPRRDHPLLSTEREIDGVWVTELDSITFLARAGEPGAPLVVERFGAEASIHEPVRVDGFAVDRPVAPLSVVARQGEARLATLLAESFGGAARVHLAVIGADGTWGARTLFERAGRVVGVAFSERGDLLVLTDRVDEATFVTHVELRRFACDGALLEPPLEVEAGPNLRARALGVEPGAARAWVVLSENDYDEVHPGDVRPHFVHSVRSVRLP